MPSFDTRMLDENEDFQRDVSNQKDYSSYVVIEGKGRFDADENLWPNAEDRGECCFLYL